MSKQAIEMIGSIDYINNFNEQAGLLATVRANAALRLSGIALAGGITLTGCSGNEAAPETLGANTRPVVEVSPTPIVISSPLESLAPVQSPEAVKPLSAMDITPIFSSSIKTAADLVNAYNDLYSLVQTSKLPANTVEKEVIVDLFMASTALDRDAVIADNLRTYEQRLSVNPQDKAKFTRKLVKIVNPGKPSSGYWDLRAVIQIDTPETTTIEDTVFQFGTAVSATDPDKRVWRIIATTRIETETTKK